MGKYVGIITTCNDNVDDSYKSLAKKISNWLIEEDYNLVFGASSKGLMGVCYDEFIKNGDINNDGIVDLLDVKQLFRIYMVTVDRNNEEFIKKYDFDDDKSVDLLDVKKLFRLYMTGYFN